MKIKSLLIAIFSMLSLSAFAQEGGFTGRVVSRLDREPIEGVKVTTAPLAGRGVTDADGLFTITGVEAQQYMVEFSAPGYDQLSVVVRVEDPNEMRDMYTIIMVPAVETSMVDDAFFTEFDSDISSDGTASPAALSASRDIFSSSAAYKFGEMRFAQRGYASNYSTVYLNGLNMNDALTGYSSWSLWGGLNDVTRDQESTVTLGSSDYGLGGLNGTTNIVARASSIRRGWSTGGVAANNMYRFRAMVTYGSGMKDNGWAYAFSVSTRQGGNDYIDGVFYNTLSYFGSVEKRFNDEHQLAFMVLGAPTQRGAQQASTQEVYDLLDNNYYNPNVGIQNGELRNTRIRESHEPIATLNYTFTPSDRSKLNMAASFRFGKSGSTALTWNAGSDPRADYYRYLPSYYNCTNPALLTDMWQNDYDNISRIDLDALIQVNYNGPEDYDTYGAGHRSYYMIEKRHTDQKDFNFASQYERRYNGGSVLHLGGNLRYNRTEYYSTVYDLLGGDYWIDIDKFAERDFGDNAEVYQNNLMYYYENGCAPIAREGDKYSYDYFANVVNASVWGTYDHVFSFAPNLTASLSGELGLSSMWREGVWLKGLFQDSSLGKSEKITNITYKTKLNVNYVINRSLSLTANAAYMNNAPTFSSVFISPRSHNMVTPGLDTEKIASFDIAMDARFGDAKFRVAGYYTTIEDQNRVISFYNDLMSSYDNFAMSGVDSRYMGVEFAMSVPVVAGISVNSALSLGEYVYSSNPYYIEMADNSAEVLSEGIVYWEGYKVEGTPQFAANVGLSYRSPKYLSVSLDFNYYANNYLSMNPIYRTDSAITESMYTTYVEGTTTTLAEAMRSQERFDDAFTLNATIGKSWYIKRKYSLGGSFTINNILNNQSIKVGGFEQMRLSEDTSQGIYERFDSKYFYMLGRTYFLNIYLRF
ncbi:MAG: TonB-dependent receptor [Rikenellaceae bacterium]